MNARTLCRPRFPLTFSPPDPAARRAPGLAARSVLRLLTRLQVGSLALHGADGQWRHYGTGAATGPRAEVWLHDWKALTLALRRGDIGFAEGYVRGLWDTPDLAALLDLLAANRAAIEPALHGSRLALLGARLRHLLFKRNSRRGSRDNIHAHYDLGNAFYALWLDPSFTYSSALFAAPGMTLQAAQQAKYARVLDQLGAASGDKVLEIGCGWGGLAEAAAARGLCVDGITLSTEQLAYAHDRTASLTPRPRLELCDYRDVARLAPAEGYDAIASIEMFEAVGEAYWPSFFRTVARHLKRGGRACIQTIVIDDALFDGYRTRTDFIQRYIFPGGMLPSRAAFAAQAQAAGLAVVDAHAFGLDYAHTLAAWRQRFTAQLDAVRALGFDEAFIRLWTFYLAYCEAGFRQRSTDVVQFTLRHA